MIDNFKKKIDYIIDNYSVPNNLNFIKINHDSIINFYKKVILNNKNVIIGITGETASGKSKLTKKIAEVSNTLNLPVGVFSTDNYFKNISELIKKAGSFDDLVLGGYDIDSPESTDLELLKNDIIDLLNGVDIYGPKYLLNGTGISIPKSIPIKSNKVMIAEGVAVGYGDIHNVIDLLLYVEVDYDLRKERFLKRSKDRLQSLEKAKMYWDYVCNAGKKYLQPMREKADIIIDGNSNINSIEGLIKILLDKDNK